jgi:hypothetical protein
MPLVNFKFSAEQLTPDQQCVAETDCTPSSADIGSLLFKTQDGSRIDYITNAREGGIGWYPELKYSVVNVFADTWACICCRCPRLGCTRPVNYCGFYLYRLSLTRAQWLWMFNLLCMLVHFTMAYLCLTACNGNRFGTETVNPNCTAAGMQVTILRATSNCKNTPLEP